MEYGSIHDKVFILLQKVCIASIKAALANPLPIHYNDVIMGAMTSQITSLMIVYSSVYSGADQRKYQSSASLAFVRGIHRWPVISPHTGPVTRKMFPFDDVIMFPCYIYSQHIYSQKPLSLGTSFINRSLIEARLWQGYCIPRVLSGWDDWSRP